MGIVGLGSSLMHRNKDVGGNCEKAAQTLNTTLHLHSLGGEVNVLNIFKSRAEKMLLTNNGSLKSI